MGSELASTELDEFARFFAAKPQKPSQFRYNMWVYSCCIHDRLMYCHEGIVVWIVSKSATNFVALQNSCAVVFHQTPWENPPRKYIENYIYICFCLTTFWRGTFVFMHMLPFGQSQNPWFNSFILMLFFSFKTHVNKYSRIFIRSKKITTTFKIEFCV